MSTMMTCAFVLTVLSGVKRWELGRCTSCVPRCPMGHSITKAAQEGILFASLMMLLAAVIHAVMTP